MANTFFGFDTSLNHGDHRLSPDEDCLETEEEEYDALNDETFGTLEDSSNVEDWEQQHEQLAEIAESSRRSEHLENSISQLVSDNSDDSPTSLQDDALWSYMSARGRNGDIFNATLASNTRKSSKLAAEVKPNVTKLFNSTPPVPVISTANITNIPKKICTVEELERGLLNSRIQKPPVPSNMPPAHISHPMFQQPPHPPRLPPGLHAINLPPQLRHLQPMPPASLPPGLVRMMAPYPPAHNGPPHPAHRLVYHGNSQFPVNHPFNFPPPPRNTTTQNTGQPNRNFHQQRNRVEANSFRQKLETLATNVEILNKDEYAGLMANREKQWLLNIQMLQLNTGTPYFDDYYYTVFKERKSKSNKENQQLLDRNQRYMQGNSRGSQRDHYRTGNDRQDTPNPLQQRVYTPLQFENSLGKLQCGSVTAPRKIIDMDVVTLEKDTESVTISRDTRKTKQLLLELEAMYSLILKAEDLRNPTALSNMEKLRELKQKQRLRELEAAPTPEQKQEVLKLLQQESIPVVENPHDYLVKVVNGLLQDDKYTSFFNIRKGKMLLLRVLPYLTAETFVTQLLDLWLKLLLSIPIVGRRDTAGDNLLSRLHPYFKRYIQTCKMSDILEIATNITEVVRQENSRSTPSGHQGKAPLHFIVGNKFGVSSLVTMLIRCEYLISSENASEKQQSDWHGFLMAWLEAVSVASSAATPIELIPRQVFIKHCNRIANLSPDKKLLFENKFVDAN